MMTQLSSCIVNDVEITTEYDENGVVISQMFKPVEKKPESESDNQSPLKIIWDWCRNLFYMKHRDFSDPFSERNKDPFDDGSGGKDGIEVGMKISF